MIPEATAERRFIGVVEVDSGTLLVGDPTYCLPHKASGKEGIDYEAVIAAEPAVGIYLGGQPVLLISNFGGDGTFPVYAEFDEDGEVARVTIEFLPPDDGSDEDDEGVTDG